MDDKNKKVFGSLDLIGFIMPLCNTEVHIVDTEALIGHVVKNLRNDLINFFRNYPNPHIKLHCELRREDERRHVQRHFLPNAKTERVGIENPNYIGRDPINYIRCATYFSWKRPNGYSSNKEKPNEYGHFADWDFIFDNLPDKRRGLCRDPRLIWKDIPTNAILIAFCISLLISSETNSKNNNVYLEKVMNIIKTSIKTSQSTSQITFRLRPAIGGDVAQFWINRNLDFLNLSDKDCVSVFQEAFYLRNPTAFPSAPNLESLLEKPPGRPTTKYDLNKFKQGLKNDNGTKTFQLRSD